MNPSCTRAAALMLSSIWCCLRASSTLMSESDRTQHANLEVRLDPGENLVLLERLRDVVGSAELEPLETVGRLHVRGEEDHGDPGGLRVLLELLANGVAVLLRHHHVEQDQVGLEPIRELERPSPRCPPRAGRNSDGGAWPGSASGSWRCRPRSGSAASARRRNRPAPPSQSRPRFHRRSVVRRSATLRSGRTGEGTGVRRRRGPRAPLRVNRIIGG